MQQNRDMGTCVSHEIYVDIHMYVVHMFNRSLSKFKVVFIDQNILLVWLKCMFARRFIYLGRCWRWIRKPDSQTDSSQIGASTPDSTFSWTAKRGRGRGGGRDRERERKTVVSFHWGENLGETEVQDSMENTAVLTFISLAQEYYSITV